MIEIQSVGNRPEIDDDTIPQPAPERRIVQHEFAALVASRLAVGGRLHVATDWEPYAEQMLEVLSASPELENLHAASDGGYAPRPEWRPVTKFERQGLDKGHIVHDLVFRRR